MAHSNVVIPKKNKWFTKYSVDAVKKYMYTRVRGETNSAMIQFVPYTSFRMNSKILHSPLIHMEKVFGNNKSTTTSTEATAAAAPKSNR